LLEKKNERIDLKLNLSFWLQRIKFGKSKLLLELIDKEL